MWKSFRTSWGLPERKMTVPSRDGTLVVKHPSHIIQRFSGNKMYELLVFQDGDFVEASGDAACLDSAVPCKLLRVDYDTRRCIIDGDVWIEEIDPVENVREYIQTYSADGSFRHVYYRHFPGMSIMYRKA